MDFSSVEQIKAGHFGGFITVGGLRANKSIIPDSPGVYMVLCTLPGIPAFLKKGTGGYFKGKEPNVSVNELSDNWVEGTPVVYIGKAGSEKGRATLRKRLDQYFRFGNGEAIGHYGGRFIWQIPSAADLLVCWKTTSGKDAETTENEMLKAFLSKYGKLPFANLRM